jgi:hypothetical protein
MRKVLVAEEFTVNISDPVLLNDNRGGRQAQKRKSKIKRTVSP